MRPEVRKKELKRFHASAKTGNALERTYYKTRLPTPGLVDTSEFTDKVKAIDPSNSPRRLVIFLHGIGGSGSVMMPISTLWKSALDHTRFVAPNAPFPHRYGGHQWFGVDNQVLRDDRIRSVRHGFDTVIEDIVRREGFEKHLDKVAFVGVSQGAIMALDAVSSGRWKVGALVSFAGLLPLAPVVQAGGKTPVLLMHGREDKTIPPGASLMAAGQLKAAGFEVAVKVFPDVGHTISPEEAQEALVFLQRHLAP